MCIQIYSICQLIKKQAWTLNFLQGFFCKQARLRLSNMLQCKMEQCEWKRTLRVKLMSKELFRKLQLISVSFPNIDPVWRFLDLEKIIIMQFTRPEIVKWLKDLLVSIEGHPLYIKVCSQLSNINVKVSLWNCLTLEIVFIKIFSTYLK